MKKYLADLLTLARVVFAVVLIVMAVSGGTVGAGLVVFILAELTDAFDGTCARKWPFPAGKEPKYRRYAVKYDMLADALLWFAAVLFFTLRVNFTVGLIIMIGVAVICGVVELIIYGKLFGHPDNCTKNSLCARNFKLAKKIVMARRWFYLATIFVVAGWMLVAAEWATATKIAVVVVGVLISVFLWFFLKQRRQNISRDAVELEKKLSQKSRK